MARIFGGRTHRENERGSRRSRRTSRSAVRCARSAAQTMSVAKASNTRMAAGTRAKSSQFISLNVPPMENPTTHKGVVGVTTWPNPRRKHAELVLRRDVRRARSARPGPRQPPRRWARDSPGALFCGPERMFRLDPRHRVIRLRCECICRLQSGRRATACRAPRSDDRSAHPCAWASE